MNAMNNMNSMMNMIPMQNFNMQQLQASMKPLSAYDPNTLPAQQKRFLLQENISLSKIHEYKIFQKYPPVYNKFLPSYDGGNPDSLFTVNICYEHSVDIAEKYAEKGQYVSPNNGSKPVIVNQVGKDFNGTNFEISSELKDEMINMRTNLNCVFGTANYNKDSLLTDHNTCLYSRLVTVIRDKNFQKMPFLQVYRFATITVTPVNKPTLIDNSMMCMNDYKNTLNVIETIFQTAIAEDHKVLILPPFGHYDENPIDDIIKIYNYCIFKYGHKIGTIIIAIPPYMPKDIFEEYDKKIMRPQNMLDSVDKKYDQLEFETKLEKPKEQTIEQPELDSNQMEQFMKMLKNPMIMKMVSQMK